MSVTVQNRLPHNQGVSFGQILEVRMHSRTQTQKDIQDGKNPQEQSRGKRSQKLSKIKEGQCSMV